MNRNDIIRMAREAGFDLEMWQLSLGSNVWGTHEELERFAALVAAAEREACAKVCGEYSAVGKIEEFDRGWLACAKAISNVIRARGQA